ncbi:MAG TPA: ParB/RepB/Spo0J family partition protein [Verrucomicrobiae bacterium]|nr:ParB/RepB/Spo0J family partition protein [Verrucomicrobiae bacterium]
MIKKALGKGLSALIPDTYVKSGEVRKDLPAVQAAQPQAETKLPENALEMIPIEHIRANEDQPRKEFKPEAIEDLAASIREKGILQPVIVKKIADKTYELICGERRYRAAILCGLEKVPAVIKDIARSDFLEWALIENIQREDLNPIEEAEAYQKLAEDHKISQDEIAKRLGKSRVAVTNTLRLLRLPQDLRGWLVDGVLSAGHARALLGLLTPEHQRQIAKRIVEENLSVRQVETLVNRSLAHKRKPKKARNLSPEIVDLENHLSRHLGTQVRVHPKKNMKQGRIELHYFSLDELDSILERMRFPKV